MQLILYGIYLFFAVYIAGNIITLQIQHYSIYSFIGKEHFKDYIRANNKAAWISNVLPAIILLIANICLVFYRPSFMSVTEAIFSLILVILGLISTFIGQRKVQTEMEETGYSEERISFLISTNWIRSFLHVTVSIMAVAIIMNAVI